MSKRKTIGQIAQEKQQEKIPEKKLWPYVEEAAKDFMANLLECVERGKKLFENRDFFISNAGKNEQILWNVMRSYWIPLQACPTPNFDQVVFRYRWQSEQLEEVWCIPTKDACEYLIRNKNYVIPAEQDVLAYTIAFVDGSLEKMAKFLNEEKEDAPNIILQTTL